MVSRCGIYVIHCVYEKKTCYYMLPRFRFIGYVFYTTSKMAVTFHSKLLIILIVIITKIASFINKLNRIFICIFTLFVSLFFNNSERFSVNWDISIKLSNLQLACLPRNYFLTRVVDRSRPPLWTQLILSYEKQYLFSSEERTLSFIERGENTKFMRNIIRLY